RRPPAAFLGSSSRRTEVARPFVHAAEHVKVGRRQACVGAHPPAVEEHAGRANVGGEDQIILMQWAGSDELVDLAAAFRLARRLALGEGRRDVRMDCPWAYHVDLGTELDQRARQIEEGSAVENIADDGAHDENAWLVAYRQPMTRWMDLF